MKLEYSDVKEVLETVRRVTKCKEIYQNKKAFWLSLAQKTTVYSNSSWNNLDWFNLYLSNMRLWEGLNWKYKSPAKLLKLKTGFYGSGCSWLLPVCWVLKPFFLVWCFVGNLFKMQQVCKAGFFIGWFLEGILRLIIIFSPLWTRFG